MATSSPTRGSGFWFIIIALTIIIIGGIWWFSVSDDDADGVDRDLDPAVAEPLENTVSPGNPEPTLSAPAPLPDSPVATGTVGVPSGTTGASAHPGDPTRPGAATEPTAGTN